MDNHDHKKFLYQKTEEFAAEAERSQREWNEQNEEYLSDFLRELDLCICEKSAGRDSEIWNVFSDNERAASLVVDPDFLAVCFIYEILTREWECGITPTLVMGCNSLEEVKAVIDEVRMLLFRIEFSGDEEALLEFAKYLSSSSLSPIALLRILETSTYDTAAVKSVVRECCLLLGKDVHASILG